MTKTMEIAGKTYERRECCGDGRSHDATNADKVNVGYFADRCGSCGGRGYTLHDVAILASAARATLASVSGEVGDMPDWMC